MYSSAGSSVNAARSSSPAVVLAVAALAVSTPIAAMAQIEAIPALSFHCAPDSTLAAVFVPPSPQLGRYEVCTTAEPLTKLASSRGWTVESVPPLDAFGNGGVYDRSALTRVYGGQNASVAHVWFQRGREFESITLISPYPDATLGRLLLGTLVVRFIICCS